MVFAVQCGRDVEHDYRIWKLQHNSGGRLATERPLLLSMNKDDPSTIQVCFLFYGDLRPSSLTSISTLIHSALLSMSFGTSLVIINSGVK